MTKDKPQGAEPDADAKTAAKGESAIVYLIWILGAAAALAPWYLPLLEGDLFPSYFLITKAGSSTAFLLSLVSALAFHRKTSQARMRKWLLFWIAIFATCLVGCFAVMQVFSNLWQPDARWEPLLHTVWFVFFAAVFVSLAFAIVISTYLIRGNDA